MSYIHIAVHNNRCKTFLKDWPMCKYLKKDGPSFTVFQMPKEVYYKQYKRRKDALSPVSVPSTNYVKITGSLLDAPVKLFVKENQVNRVLESLHKKHDEAYATCTYRRTTLSISMRKITIPNAKRGIKNALDSIVIKSLQALNLAA